MSSAPPPDWDPHSADVHQDQRAAYDKMRARCPVAYSDALGWSLFRHEDILAALHEPGVFSNVVSQHVAVPNGMDPPTHTAYRALIEPFFAPARMDAFEPACRRITAELVQRAHAAGRIDAMADLALPFSIRVQCAFLGWPDDLLPQLLQWTQKQGEATRSQDREALARQAQVFDTIIDDMLQYCASAAAPPNVTAELLDTQLDGAPLRTAEIVSILRNWTAGEIGTISASVGIVMQFLAEQPDIQTDLRTRPEQLDEAIDEILRLYGPLVLNRRVTTCPIDVGGRHIPAASRLSLVWMAGNRDDDAFAEADHFQLGRDPDRNLLYGAGIHVCPGAPLARLELRMIVEELLARTSAIEPDPTVPTVHAIYPDSGYSRLPIRLR